MGRDNNKKSPAWDAGQRRASSIHERLPDKPASTGIPVSGSIDHILNSSSSRRVPLKTFFHIEAVLIPGPVTMRPGGTLLMALKSWDSCNTIAGVTHLPVSKR